MNEPAPRDGRTAHPIGLRTPYELAFRTAGFEDDVFSAIEREAEQREVVTDRRDTFDLLEAAGRAVRRVVPRDAPPEAFEQYRALLHHAYRFWRLGRRMLALDVAVARYLVESAPTLEDWRFSLPHPAFYLQLPRGLFWSAVDAEATPEPVDGIFAHAVGADDPLGPPYERLHVLMVLGVRPDRAGFSVIPFDTAVGPGIPEAWIEAPGREDGRDFENVLPGGDMGGLYSLLTVAEVTKLFAWTMWYVDTHPGALEPGSPPDAEEVGGSLPPTRLSFSRIGLTQS